MFILLLEDFMLIVGYALCRHIKASWSKIMMNFYLTSLEREFQKRTKT